MWYGVPQVEPLTWSIGVERTYYLQGKVTAFDRDIAAALMGKTSMLGEMLD